MRKSEQMSTPEEMPPYRPEESDPANEWWKEKPGVRAYKIGDIVDRNDKTRDEYLCPYCNYRARVRTKGSVRSKINEPRIEFTCPKGHGWTYMIASKRIEPLDTANEQNLPF